MDNYFFGWYFKCQTETQTLSVIPAVHRSGGKRSCSIQIITENQAWNFNYQAEDFHRIGEKICIGNNQFGERGILLDIHTPEVRIRGKLKFGKLCPLKYDIMGPFSILPLLEWRILYTVCRQIGRA